MTNPTPPSPAAQAVRAAANGASSYGSADCLNEAPQIAAASLRALVSALGTRTKGGAIILNGDAVLDLAAELEGG